MEWRDRMKFEKRTFHCDRCGRVHEEKEVSDFLGNLFHDMQVYFGYESPFDEDIVKFSICELCLFDFFKSFKHRPIVDEQDLVECFDVCRTQESPYAGRAHIETYKRLENLEKK